MLKEIQNGNKRKLTFDFYLLVVGIFTSKIGTGIYNISLTTWLTYETMDTEVLGIIMTVSTVGVLLSTPFAGWIVDMFNKKYIMVISDFVSGFVSLTVSWYAYHNKIDMYMLILCSFMLSFSSSIFKPASKAFIPCIVNKDGLLRANSVVTALSESATLLSPLLTTIIFFNMENGVVLAFLINAITYFCSAIIELCISYKNKMFVNKEDIKVISSFAKSISFLIHEKTILSLIIYSSFINFFCSGFNIIFPVYVGRVLSLTDYDYSYLMTYKAVGALFISIIFIIVPSFKVEKIVSMYISLLLYGLALIFMECIGTKTFSAIALFITGSATTYFNIIFFTFVQKLIRESLIGKILSIVYTSALITSPIAYLFFGFTTKYFLNNALFVLGIGVILTTIVFFGILMIRGFKNSK